MNNNDFMNQPSGVFAGEWELTNAGLFIAEWMGFNPKNKKQSAKRKKKNHKKRKR